MVRVREPGSLRKSSDVRRAHEVAALHVLVHLRAGERVRCARLRDLDAARDPERVGRADRVRVEAGARAEPPGARAAVAEVDGDGVVRVAGLDPDGRLDGPPAERDADDVLLGEREPGAAVAGERIAALSQVSFVSGFGSSWSQPLLAKRPS